MRKVIGIMLAVLMVVGYAGPILASGTNISLKSENTISEEEWHPFSAAFRLGEMEIINGYGDGEMGLTDEITRAQIVTILVRAFVTEGEKEKASMTKDIKFADIVAEQWYTEAINVAYTKGWVVGDSEGNFRPNDPVQYREALTMVMRAMGYNEDNLEGKWPLNYVSRADELMITSGMVYTDEVLSEDGFMTQVGHRVEFNSKENATRGDVFALLDRVIDYDIYKEDALEIIEEYKPIAK